MDASVTKRKREIREEILAARGQFRQSELEHAAQDACEQLFAADVLSGSNIMLYAAFGNEVPTRPFLERALALGMKVAYPRVIRKKRLMEAAWVDGSHQLRPGVMDILEPEPTIPALDPTEITAIIVPGLAFDQRGFRIGYGAGYYDRFLPTAIRAVRIGLTLSRFVYDVLPTHSHDEKMDWILTEKGLFKPHLA